jgi:hypothetical protein
MYELIDDGCSQVERGTIMEEKGNPNSIKLPDTLEVFRNLKNAKQFAIDIGTCHDIIVICESPFIDV